LPTPADPAAALLRPAVELAWVVARAGLAERPAVDPPRELRPFLRFAKLPPRGAAVIRRVLDDDESFRSRVVAAADEAELERASWLFLTRPAGWEAAVDALTSAASTAAQASREAASESRASRRLAGAEDRIARLTADAAEARARAAQAVEELAALRRVRQDAGRRVSQAEGERDAARAEAARLRDEVAELRVRLDRLTAASTASPSVPVAPPPPSVDVAGVRAALDAARDAARSLAASLDEATAALPADTAAPPARRPAAKRARALPTAVGRRPIPLPPGLLDDSVEVAEHLVRTSGVVVLVDGYNATISAWPDLPLPEQRTRLVDALAELVARTGADATVVFDGTQEAPPQVGSRTPRSPVKILFSPADVPADDVILDLVDQVSPLRPVLVASDDRRVQDGARRRGANVLTRVQLLATLRRGPSSALG
jgi:predicted RNA-binding protein with PIN domain